MTDASAEPAQTLTERVAAAVRTEVRKAELTQRELAAIIGVHQPNVSLRLRGKIPFTTAELGKIAAALNVPVSMFFVDAEPADSSAGAA